VLTRRKRPVPPDDFSVALDKLCKSLNIAVRAKGRKAWQCGALRVGQGWKPINTLAISTENRMERGLVLLEQHIKRTWSVE
jgi:hypothetical protein